MKAGEKQRTPRRHVVPCFVSVPALMTSVACPACGAGVDLWSDDEETRCFACDHAIFEKQRADH